MLGSELLLCPRLEPLGTDLLGAGQFSPPRISLVSQLSSLDMLMWDGIPASINAHPAPLLSHLQLSATSLWGGTAVSLHRALAPIALLLVCFSF